MSKGHADRIRPGPVTGRREESKRLQEEKKVCFLRGVHQLQRGAVGWREMRWGEIKTLGKWDPA